QRLPLGLAIAIDFLGPLSVAVFGYCLSWRLTWPLIAAAGILFLAHDGEGWVGNSSCVLFALGSAVGSAGRVRHRRHEIAVGRLTSP
ncbi:hypothetical protein ACC862_37530, partial [Rhizobium ruizarguesonis]